MKSLENIHDTSVTGMFAVSNVIQRKHRGGIASFPSPARELGFQA